ncbi:MAG: 50S ribosomal protein L18 [Rhodospirillales bacterium]|nr:50S ribosomal protein L18 [Rhodospirillales bacterium]MCW8863022.1 50S ribosomal protein L18 [Rhodospirillales bacterium]MCW8951793.1 50S ribosomal protein L18 [Rhodospirillales bacterium]MCW8970007.1 50S ribosomal protein L18 [Rhodospirillales bacterium]MCW9002206.1 50S ribosomal protein L18 [Rhodospirillales bacterium]
MKTARELFERRKRRTRHKIRLKAAGRPRLTVFRSCKHIYAQVIDDVQGMTLATASTKDADYKGKSGSTAEAAAVIGKMIAERALKAGVKEVAFDRGGYVYHGRVKALGDAARESGLTF